MHSIGNQIGHGRDQQGLIAFDVGIDAHAAGDLNFMGFGCELVAHDGFIDDGINRDWFQLRQCFGAL